MHSARLSRKDKYSFDDIASMNYTEAMSNKINYD